jgi:hypothetical protein
MVGLLSVVAKLKASALKPRALTDKEEHDRAEEGYETEEGGEDAVVEEGDKGSSISLFLNSAS